MSDTTLLNLFRAHVRLAFAASFFLFAACGSSGPDSTGGEDAAQRTEDVKAADGGSAGKGGTGRVADCKDQHDGKACGEGVARHCKNEECVEDAQNAASPSAKCGNAEADDGEECDDGNEAEDDGCSKQCKKLECGNKRKDPGEECDDGNDDDGDGCSACKMVMCGDGNVQGPEECDDGNSTDDDKCSNKCSKNECGNKRLDPGEKCELGLTLGCSKTCEPGPDTCTPCEEMHCRKYLEELDLVAGCLENNPDTNVTMKPKPGPDEFSKPCKEILSCSRQNQCTQAAAKGGPDACLCGGSSADACQEEKQADAPCYDKIASAAETSDHTDVILRWSDMQYPSGYAYFMLKCDMERCQKECLPWLDSQ